MNTKTGGGREGGEVDGLDKGRSTSGLEAKASIHKAFEREGQLLSLSLFKEFSESCSL